jgi:hypothetical protein
MTKGSRAADFLRSMNVVPAVEVAPSNPAPPSTQPVALPAPVPAANRNARATAPTREGKKHIGGYVDDGVVEKVAILRARLRLDNSELIKLAIDELYAKHLSKRAFE